MSTSVPFKMGATDCTGKDKANVATCFFVQHLDTMLARSLPRTIGAQVPFLLPVWSTCLFPAMRGICGARAQKTPYVSGVFACRRCNDLACAQFPLILHAHLDFFHAWWYLPLQHVHWRLAHTHTQNAHTKNAHTHTHRRALPARRPAWQLPWTSSV